MAIQYLEIPLAKATDSVTAVTAGLPLALADEVSIVYDDSFSKIEIINSIERIKNRLIELID